jgi:hypothetical protein
MKEGPLLTDKGVFPDDAVLEKHLGNAAPAWNAFALHVRASFGDGALEWRYYNDGKAWLAKVVHRKKTVCWASVWDKYFRAAFYFTAKCDADIEALPIPLELKERYRAHEPIGKLKPLVVDVKTKKALKAVFTLLEYKSSLK